MSTRQSKLFLTVLLLAAITTIGISQDKQSKLVTGRERLMKMAKAAKTEEERIAKLPKYIQSLAGVKGVCVLIEVLNKDTRAQKAMYSAPIFNKTASKIKSLTVQGDSYKTIDVGRTKLCFVTV